jgi:pimeloyl-ACP methyl ester carboxylesterase
MLKFIKTLLTMPRPAPRPNPRPTHRATPPSHTPEVVDPKWILKAVGLVILAALVCGYLTLCLLFYQGQWQLVLHPTKAASSTPPVPGAEVAHFGLDESATPQLNGWWIPSPAGGRYSTLTLLYLRQGDGALADSTAALNQLHQLGINILAFDYRGYGASLGAHPDQQRMLQDVGSALDYLHTIRAIPERQIIPYGVGVGASLATSLAAAHPAMPAVILESARGDLLNPVLQDPRSSLVPARLLFHERFPLQSTLAALKTPKLLFAAGTLPDTPRLFQSAAAPKITVELPQLVGAPFEQAISRFLDQYVASPIPVPTAMAPATVSKMTP